MHRKFVSFTTDIGWSEELAMMKAVALQINPDALIIDLRHDVPSFDVTEGAWTLESIAQLPVGYHVCVVDPGVGTSRKAIIIKTRRGDYLVGPDNGVLIPAAERFLGGIEKAVEITNEKYMRKPVSHVFHGRDIFTPAAAWLSKGVRIEEFGPVIRKKDLAKAPYGEAKVSKGLVSGEIIHINRFGNVFVNVRYDNFLKSGITHMDNISIETAGKRINTKFLKTFGDVPKGNVVAFPDDFGRIEIALNQGNFSKKFGTKVRDEVKTRKL